MLKYLDLREDCLARPARIDLAMIEARMLWPHHADMRKRYVNAVSIKLAAGNIDRVPFPTPTPIEVRELAESMLSAPRVEDFTDAGKRAYTHGLVAGNILFEAVGNRDTGCENTGLGDIKSALVARLGREQHLSQKTIDNVVWPRYRSVAHLWAAHLHRSKETENTAFPCRARDLPIFLALAEAYRRRGETIRSTAKSPSTVLRPGDAVMVPRALNLPEVALAFSTKK